jgi:tetratricopeptide (TPR) repeat protein
LSIAREIGNRHSEGTALANLAGAFCKLEQYSEALYSSQKALEIFQNIDERYSEAIVCKNLAEIHHELGNLNRAIDFCNQALALTTELGIPLAKDCQELKAKLAVAEVEQYPLLGGWEDESEAVDEIMVEIMNDRAAHPLNQKLGQGIT